MSAVQPTLPETADQPHAFQDDEGPDSIRNRVWFAVVAALLTAMAAGMGWGIRGQYGHETGAMIAGTLAALTLVMLFIPQSMSLTAARGAAMMAVATGIGGSMTYGQSVGLTHDAELIGNLEALRWGMLGLAIKGAGWIGFAGLFLGMGLGGIRYRSSEMLLLFLAMMGLYIVGIQLLNSPFDPAEKVLPAIYFSDDWYFEPGKADLSPRPETWGGYWLALLFLTAYTRFVRGDRLAPRMALAGIIGGGLGFPGGQCIQALHAWHPEIFAEGGTLGFAADYFRYFNWWNMMETTFGMIWGGALATGLWFNRHLIRSYENAAVTLPPGVELMLMAAHLVLIINGEFLILQQPWIATPSYFYVLIGVLVASIPMLGIVGGRWWPYLTLTSLIAAPICGKTLRAMRDNPSWSETQPAIQWLLLIVAPLVSMTLLGIWLALRSGRQSGGYFASVTLLATTMLYFVLNSVFFDWAWPWNEQWTGRTPNQLIFMVCAGSLLLAAFTSLAMRSSSPLPNQKVLSEEVA